MNHIPHIACEMEPEFEFKTAHLKMIAISLYNSISAHDMF